MRPSIGLDLLSLQGPKTGMAWQAFWLAHWMPRLMTEMDFVFFLPPDVEAPASGPNVEIIRVPTGRFRGARVLDEQWTLARAAARRKPDLFHTIAYGPPVLYPGVRILTIHDLAFRLFPETVPQRYRTYWNWAYGAAAAGCRRLIAVSESTRNDIVRVLHRDPNEVSVVTCGVDPVYAPAPAGRDDPRPDALRGLPARYILNVGTIQPRKDFATLLRTYARLRPEFPDLWLVVAGGRGWGYGDPLDMVRREGLEDRVRLLEFAPPEIMPDLYRGAGILLFPSLYEGFGLPILEAMASGTPVVAVNSSSIPEVVGDAGLLSPPRDDAGLAAHARSILRDPAKRADLARRGLERARLFSWRKAAEETIKVYQSVLSETGAKNSPVAPGPRSR
jgi:glycosyltransferase involved in cell wall biosynthesis